MKNLINRLPGVLLPILTAIAGLALGLVAFYIVTIFERRGTWEQLNAPPGDIVRLVTADNGKVFVETADKITYRVSCRAEYPDEICWERVDPPQNTLLLPCRDESLPPPPGKTQDRLETCFYHEYSVLSQYALLEDGSLWRWESHIYPLGEVANLFWTVVLSVILGAVVGLVLLAAKEG